LRFAEARTQTGTATKTGWSMAFEEYRYDGLGRRVLVRARQTDYCDQPQTAACGHIERTVWDGDQVLYEIRARGGIGATATQLENDNDAGEVLTENRWGRVLYQHAGGIDMPVNIIRMRMAGQPEVIAVSPHANWQGDMEVGSLMSGTSTDQCSAGQYGCPVVGFPGSRIPADGGAGPSGGGWFGNLITGKTDASGLQYMRNRYYDPATGRFTQQDPIGLAGGLNLYGFVSGDPVNFSDPFGLNPCEGLEGEALEKCLEGERRRREQEQQQEAPRQAIAQCRERNRFSSLFGDGVVRDVVRFAEVGSAVSLGTDAPQLTRPGTRPPRLGAFAEPRAGDQGPRECHASRFRAICLA
jgi:RHS repeat-associated protein